MTRYSVGAPTTGGAPGDVAPEAWPASARALRHAGLALVLAVLLAPEPVGAQARTGVVAGLVTTVADTAVPTAMVSVQGTLLRVLTDRGGRFVLRGLPAGRQTLRVYVLGYQPASVDVTVTPGDTTHATLTLQPQVVPLPDLVVTASRVEQQRSESPVSIDVIPQVSLKLRNVVTINQALPYASGVTYAGGQFDVRGSAGLSGGVGSRVLLLLDGHPLLTGDTGEMDFDALPVLGVERIEIVKGPYSALYGSNALGGVINIITSPVPQQPHVVARAYVGVYDPSSDDHFTDHALLTRGLELEQSVRSGPLASRFFLGRTRDDGFTQNGQNSRWLARAETSFGLGSAAPSSLYAIWSQEDVGEFFGWRADSLRLQVPPDAVGDWYRNAWLNLGATLNVLTRPSVGLSLGPYLYFDAVQNHFHDNTDWHRATHAGSTALLSLRPRGGQALTLGGEAGYTTVSSNLLGRPHVYDLALFGQDELQVIPRVKATVGARLDDHQVHDPRVTNGAEAQVSPKLGLVFHATPGLDVRASVSRGFRAPAPVEQFVSTVQYGVQVIPNPDLHSESVTAGELGGTASLGRVWVDGAVFQSDFRDLIQPAAAPGQLFVFQFRNVDRARVRGIDLETRVALVPDLLEADLTYMFLNPRDLLTGKALPYRSAHTGTATIALLRGLLAVDAQYRSRVQEVVEYPLDPRGPATILGLRANYLVRGVLIQARVSNVLQARYVDLQERFPGAPRSFMLTLSRGM